MPSENLAIRGGKPVRTTPLPLEFPGAQMMDEREVEAAARVLRSRSLFRYYGIQPQREVEAFEEEFARFVGVRHALGVSSGTGALHTAMMALAVGPGDEVIVPAYLWVSVLAAIVNCGAVPVLADIDDTFCLDPADLERRITPRTAGVVFVHMSGAPGDVEPAQAVARRRGLFLLEDCAQCAGGTLRGRPVGGFGDMAIFSFQTNKNMTAGEGGCVVTNDVRLYRRAFAAHDLGYARDEAGRLILDQADLRLWGMGYRLDELRAAVLRVQLSKLPAIACSMRRSKYRMRAALEKLRGIGLRRILDPAGDTGAFLITTYRDSQTAREFNAALRAEGIVTWPQGVANVLMTDWGLHLYYNNASLVHRAAAGRAGFPWSLPQNAACQDAYRKGTCPAADGLFERSILLPVPSCLSPADEDDVIRAFQKVAAALRQAA